MRLLEQADVIIYAGSLVNPELLAYAGKDWRIFKIQGRRCAKTGAYPRTALIRNAQCIQLIHLLPDCSIDTRLAKSKGVEEWFILLGQEQAQ